MTNQQAIPSHITDYLVDRYNLDTPDAVRYIADPDYAEGAIECNGRMPNSVETGWFFAGYESEIEREIEREAPENDR